MGRTDNECVSGDPLKCQACLGWQAPRVVTCISRKVSDVCWSQAGTVGTQNILG